MKKVYLAGPISGLSFEKSTDWREYAIRELDRYDIKGLSPMRYKEYLNKESSIADSYESSVLSSARGITTRDRWDCSRADIVLVNLTGTSKISIGTVMEIAWADVYRIPTVIVMEPEGNLHDYAMIRECTGFRVETLTQGLEVVEALLT